MIVILIPTIENAVLLVFKNIFRKLFNTLPFGNLYKSPVANIVLLTEHIPVTGALVTLPTAIHSLTDTTVELKTTILAYMSPTAVAFGFTPAANIRLMAKRTDQPAIPDILCNIFNIHI